MFIHTQTLQRVTESEIRQAFANTTFATPFTPPEGYAVLFPTPRPEYDPITLSVRELEPIEVDGKWCQQWDVYPLDPELVAANQLAAALRLKKEIIFNTQKRLDTFASTRNYDGILSLATYATSPTAKFSAEGQYGVDARDATWAKLYDMLAEVQAGTRPMPNSFSDIEAELPMLAWP